MLHSSSALECLRRLAEGDLPADYARKILALDFSSTGHARYTELSGKVQLGQLTDDERRELDDLLTANDVLMLLQSKARSSLSNTTAA